MEESNDKRISVLKDIPKEVEKKFFVLFTSANVLLMAGAAWCLFSPNFLPGIEQNGLLNVGLEDHPPQELLNNASKIVSEQVKSMFLWMSVTFVFLILSVYLAKTSLKLVLDAQDSNRKMREDNDD